MTMNTEPERGENVIIAVALALAVVASVGMILLALLGVVRAEPQARTLYSDRGQEIGRAVKRGNSIQFYNDRGQEIGRSERKSDGVTNYYDERGRIIGTSRERR
jgi:YD repeat-containing protein